MSQQYDDRCISKYTRLQSIRRGFLPFRVMREERGDKGCRVDEIEPISANGGSPRAPQVTSFIANYSSRSLILASPSSNDLFLNRLLLSIS
jgi:hypothetical protein